MDTIESEIFETAKRVLPGGTFGNFPGEVIIREGKGAAYGTRTARNTSITCSAPGRCWSGTRIPR